jgi:hypothetical protein
LQTSPTLFDLGLKLSNLVSELSPAVNKYCAIGIQLDISAEKLEQIEKDYAETDRRFFAVLNYWLRNGETVTWDTIIAALESPFVDHKTLATTLRKKYITSTTQGRPLDTFGGPACTW